MYCVTTIVLPNSLFSFFWKIKHTFFIFTNNFIDLDTLSMLPISCYWFLEVRGAAKCLPMHKTAPQKRIIWPNVNSTKKLHKPVLTRSISHSTFPLHCANLFCVFQLHFSTKGQKCVFSPIFNIKVAAQKFTNFDKFLKNTCWYDNCHNTI